MHPIIIDCIKRLENVFEKEVIGKGVTEFEAKKYMSNFTMDVIASCAFATKIDTYSEEKSDFVINAQKAFRGTWRIWVGFVMMFTSPTLFKWSGFSLFPPGVLQFFRSAVSSINLINYKNYINIIFILRYGALIMKQYPY